MESGKGKQTLQFVVAPHSVINQGQPGGVALRRRWSRVGCCAWTAYREIHFKSIHIKNKGSKTNEQTQCDTSR